MILPILTVTIHQEITGRRIGAALFTAAQQVEHAL
jgi:hypothetical protein